MPPRKLYLPVLPVKCREKLMFPLCNTCAVTLQQNTCMHTDEERAIIGTWVSEEIKLAKKKGYIITEVSLFLNDIVTGLIKKQFSFFPLPFSDV